MIIQPITLEAANYVARNMRDYDAREIFATRACEDRARLAADAAARGPLAWAAGADGVPIAVIGAHEAWPGMWLSWMFATDDFPKIGKPLTKFARRVILPALADAAARRVQCFSIEGHTQAHEWLEAFGAVRETTLRNFGKNGETFHLYAKVSG